ncbi:MAG: crotonase/enoyl-CoA hydratase family protein [Gammaproteobacteria bacterium]|nr:crotonase/enoyl-CoA hydratase family protein [Gammaproteobacteria bacterium]
MGTVLDVSIDAHVAKIVLNRPEKHNALSLELFEALGDAGQEIAANKSVRAVVLSGSGDNFCAGIDTAVFSDSNYDAIAQGLQPQAPSPANMFQRAGYVWREVPVPVICAITGVAFGGGLQIALGADIRYAHPDAKLSIMEIKWGIIPDMAITTTARHVISADKLKELAFTGRIVDAREAASLGLVTSIHDDPLAYAEQMAAEIAGKSPDAIRSMKKLFNEGLLLAEEQSLALEARLQSGLLGGANQLEAVQANVQKRTPDFSD